jgi:hypothetical protein
MKPPELRLAPECGAETLSWFLGERSSCRGTPAAPSRRGTLLSFLALQAAPQQGALRALHREASCRGRRARRRLRSEGACGAAAQQGGMCRPPALTRCLQAVRGCSARFSARRASRPDDLGLASSGGQRILASDCTRSFCVPTTCSAPLSTTLPSACAPPSLDRAPTFSHLGRPRVYTFVAAPPASSSRSHSADASSSLRTLSSHHQSHPSRCHTGPLAAAASSLAPRARAAPLHLALRPLARGAALLAQHGCRLDGQP